jgi:hypothetical protein
LLIAFPGMSWRCPPWRILTPVDDWLQGYSTILGGLVDLPVEIVRTLNLETPLRDGPPLATIYWPAVPIENASGQVFSSTLWRVIGEGGKPLAGIASGAIFGGVALFAAWYGFTEGYSRNLFAFIWGLIAAGIAYGAIAITGGVREIARLAWRWDAPLRNLKRP